MAKLLSSINGSSNDDCNKKTRQYDPKWHITRKSVAIFIATSLVFMLIIFQIVYNSSSNRQNLASAQTTWPDYYFSSVGDWGCNSNTDNTVKGIVGKNPKLVLANGDFSYQDTADCWFSKIQPFDSITKITIGNHEDISSTLLNQYMSHYGLTNQYYSFDRQNIHFLVMATDDSLSVGSAQYNFVVNDLSKAASNANINWIIVLFHRDGYTSPTTAADTGKTAIRTIYHPLFDKCHVDLVVPGHGHNYQRSYPIKANTATPTSPIITSTDTNSYKDPTGEVWAVVGTGGISLFDLTSQANWVSKQYVGYGFLNLGVINGGLTLDATFYASDGSTKDHFTITKSGSSGGGGTSSKYHYDPSLTLTGSNYQNVANSQALQLTKFSEAAWFKTSTTFSSNAYIADKGGSGSETAGKNMNYGIWMKSTSQIQAGFETSAGVDNYAQSPVPYNDGQWHYAVLTFDGAVVRLYIDGDLVSTLSTTATPDNTGTQPLRVGANSLSLSGFFTGNVDEVRVWNRVLTSTEVSSQYNEGVFDTTEQVVYLPFS
jgi:hypothetical protein